MSSKKGGSAKNIKPEPEKASESGKEKKSSKGETGSNAGKEKPRGTDLAKQTKTKLSEAQVEDMKKCFDLFDSDKSGVITVQELVAGFLALGLEERSKDIVTLVKTYERKKGYSELGFAQFLDIFTPPESQSEDSLREVFEAYDREGKGFIEVEDFKRVSQELGEKYTDMEVELMHYHADKDKDGRITFEEFEAVLNKIRK